MANEYTMLQAPYEHAFANVPPLVTPPTPGAVEVVASAAHGNWATVTIRAATRAELTERSTIDLAHKQATGLIGRCGYDIGNEVYDLVEPDGSIAPDAAHAQANDPRRWWQCVFKFLERF